jgi:RHS repeat-associated protein
LENASEKAARRKNIISPHMNSEIGTDYAVNRQYLPVVGRFMQNDPYRDACARGKPQSANRYSYVENDSVNRFDALGLAWRLVGCVTSGDVGNQCTTCWEQNDETDTLRARTICDPAFVSGFGFGGRGQEPLGIVGEVGLETPPVPVNTGPMSCGECCAVALDTCKEQFLIEMSSINLAAQAQVCLPWCIATGVGLGRCLGSCLANAANRNLRRIQRSVDAFVSCIASGSNYCAAGGADCWCPWM